MKDLVIGSKQCPVCQASAVVRGQKTKVGSPSFQCAACGAELRSKLTLKALWALPAEVLMLAVAYAAVTWLRGISFSSPSLNAAVFSGLIALSIAVSSRMALRALTFVRA